MSLLRIICSKFNNLSTNATIISIKLVRSTIVKSKGQCRLYNTRYSSLTEKFKAIDNVPEHFNLIYRNRMKNYLTIAQVCSVFGIAATTLLVMFKEDSTEVDMDFATKPKHYKDELVFFMTIIFGMGVMLQSLVYKCPIRIYNYPQKEKYIMVFYRSLPMLTRNIKCQVAEVTKLADNNVIPWGKNQYEINKQQKVILVHSYFRRPVDLQILLGEQPNDEVE